MALIDLSTLQFDQVVNLYKLDLQPIGNPFIYTFTDVADGSSAIVWSGITFNPIPMKADGFEYNGRGLMPRPKIAVSNLFGQMSALCRQYGDLKGAQLTRYRVQVADLETNNPQLSTPDIWWVERKTSEDELFVAWELSSVLDSQGAQIPASVLLNNTCRWLWLGGGFKGAYCQYSGPATTCDGRLSTCRSYGNQARYGGQPGVDRSRLR